VDVLDTHSPEALQFQLLGPVRAIWQGRTLDLGPAGPRSLLAYLLLNPNRVVSFDDIQAALWGAEPPRSARKMTHMYAARIRRELARAADAVRLTAEPGGLRLDIPPESVDAARFELLAKQALAALEDDPSRALALFERGLSLWRGAALADVSLTGNAAGPLEELLAAAEEGAAEARLALGDLSTAISDLEQLIARHPLRERPRALLITALYRAGRQAEALGHFTEFRRKLIEELGLEPSPELRRLELAILRQDSALEEPTRGVTALPPADIVALPPRRAVDVRARPRRQLLLALGAAVVVAGSILGTIFATRSGAVTLRAGSIAVLDSSTRRLERAVYVAGRPSSLLVLSRSRALVATTGDRSVVLVDLERGQVVGRVGTGVAGGRLVGYQALLPRTALLADPGSRSLVLLDLMTNLQSTLRGSLVPFSADLPFTTEGVTDAIRIPGRGAYLTGGGWLVLLGSDLDYEWYVRAAVRVAGTSGPLTFARHMVWTAPSGEHVLVGYNDRLRRVTRRIALPDSTQAIAAAGDDIWVGLAHTPVLCRYSASTGQLVRRIELPGLATAIVTRNGNTWVGTGTGQVVEVHAAAAPTLVARLAHPVTGLEAAGGRVIALLS
jgi:DNA-binding SARP family transcriptional activator